MKSILKLTIIITIATTFSVCGQSYQGWIDYKLEMKNPMPDKMSDAIWNQKMAERFSGATHFSQKYFYENESYMSETKMGNTINYQLYVPKEGLIYSWIKDADMATTLDSKKYSDAIKEIKYSDETEEILGITCKKITIISEMAETSYWYNSDYLKIDPTFFIGHKYGHYEALIEKTKSLPLKIEVKQFMLHMVCTAQMYEQTKLEANQFTLPKFKEVIPSPAN